MSSRVLRKLHGDKDITTLPTDDVSEPEELNITAGARRKQLNVNRYDLLNSHSQSESEVKEDDDNDVLSSHVQHNQEARESTRRKKRKKKKRPCESSHHPSSEDVDEVERSVREVNALLGDIHAGPARSEEKISSRPKGVLAIEHKHLNPKNELKRIFGPKVIQAENSKKRSRVRTHIKNSWLVTPKEHWPNIGKPGITMKVLEIKSGIQYFTFEHNASYQSVQKKFLDAVESLNPDNIVAIVNSHPYHIDTLIQLSDICKLSEDLAMAGELIERALYCLECAFHPLFNFTSSNCRLDYKRQENRCLYITLFKHLTFVGQKACYRTALEFCKLILSLEPEEDPLGIILAIDFYAIRAREYSWLIQFYEELNSLRNLNQLPNFAFSIAIANFYLQNDNADELLQDALLMFPGVLLPLLDKCSVHLDSRTQSHPYFNTASTKQETSLMQYIQLYVSRSYHVWKEKDLLPWLEKNTQTVMDLVDKKTPLVKDYALKRSRRYQSKLPRCVERHIFLSDLKEVMPSIAEGNAGSTFSFDPLPPLDSLNIYTRPERPRRYDNSHWSMLFVSSLMPTFNMNDASEANQQNEEENAVGGENTSGYDFNRSVTHLLDAMRDLLSSLQMPEDADTEQESGSDEDSDAH